MRLFERLLDEDDEELSLRKKLTLPSYPNSFKKNQQDEDQDFTLGKRFPQPRMKAFVDKLHANGQRWVPILDPVIHVRKGYKPYDDGMKANVFLNDQTGHPYVAQLWPGASHLPDFMHPNASSWWQEQLRSVMDEEQLGIDGIWLDMNEVRFFFHFFEEGEKAEGKRSKKEGEISSFFFPLFSVSLPLPLARSLALSHKKRSQTTARATSAAPSRKSSPTTSLSASSSARTAPTL